jgi:uncharacterized membrane protein
VGRSTEQVSTRRRSGDAEINRLASFSDGVVAIAITLLVLGLDMPRGLSESAFVSELQNLGPQLFSFVLSFLVIGRFWISHHRVFRYLRYYDDRLLSLNGLFLLAVVFLPFPTSLLGDYERYRMAFILYAASIAVTGLMLALLWWYIAYTGHLVADDLDERLRRWLLLRFLVVPVVFLASIPVALAGKFLATVAVWIFLPPAVRYLVHWRYSRSKQ